MEVWVDIKYSNCEVSNLARVRVKGTEDYIVATFHFVGLKPHKYLHVMIPGWRYPRSLHRVVLESFRPLTDQEKQLFKYECDHINRYHTRVSDNWLCNLRWCTHRYNLMNKDSRGYSMITLNSGIWWKPDLRIKYVGYRVNMIKKYHFKEKFRLEKDAAECFQNAKRLWVQELESFGEVIYPPTTKELVAQYMPFVNAHEPSNLSELPTNTPK